MVEYILMLIVTLTLVIGIATKLIPQLSEFMENYAGAYVQCLLETGELPPPLNTNPNSPCSMENMRASGRFTASSGGGSSGGGGQSGRGNNSNSNRNASDQNNGNNAGGGRGGSSSRPSQRTGANTGADAGNSGETAGSSGSKKGDKLAAAANSAANSQYSPGSTNSVPYSVQQDYGKAVTGVVRIPNTATKDEKKAIPPTSIKKDKSTGGENLRKGSFSSPVPKPDEKNQGGDSAFELGFQFGLYLRYFIIGGILLALILMVGTQINSLRKSWGAQ